MKKTNSNILEKNIEDKLIPTDNYGTVILYMPDTDEGLDQITPPLGTLAIAGYLDSMGISVLHIDQRVDSESEKLVMDQIKKGATCLGIGFGTGPQITHAINLSDAVKKEYPNFPIIWAGWHPSLLPEQTMEHNTVDIIVRGQGEITMFELVKRLRKGKNLKDLEGITYKSKGEIVNNPDRKMVDLNSFPKMPYHLIDLKKYPGPSGRKSSLKDVFVNFRSSQGCPWRCAYCADPAVFNRRWKALTADRTVDEIEHLVNEYGVTYINFVDDTFIVDPRRTKAFCEEMIRRKVKVKWSANARTGMIARLDQDVLYLLKEAGCDLIHPGVEAPNQEMLDYILKDEKEENTLIAAKKMAKAGIAGLYAFMLSFPDDPPDMVEKTFSLVRKLKELDNNNIMPVNFYVPYPGNVLYERSLKKGFKPPSSLSEWADFGTRRGLAVPWITKTYREKVMMLDKYILPAAYPSRIMKDRMKKRSLGWLYKILHKISLYRVKNEKYIFPLDWKILYAYWRFWEKWHRRIRLPHIHFR